MLWTSKKLLLELLRITIWDFGFVNRVNEENKRNLANTVNWVNWQGYKKGCRVNFSAPRLQKEGCPMGG